MTYPLSPFKPDFNAQLLYATENEESKDRVELEEQFQIQNGTNLFEWLCEAPKTTTYRVNTLSSTIQDIYDKVKAKLEEIEDSKTKVEKHGVLRDVIILRHESNVELKPLNVKNEVIVDKVCASAILRGANIFAPGVLGMTAGVKVDDFVNIYADILGKCKRGLNKVFGECNKVFIGTGLVKMTRYELFADNVAPRGVAVVVKSNVSGCPVLGNDFLSGLGLLQNFPSIVCVHILNPQPNDYILDMCASPGNKTTHIAALTNNQCVIVAIDKTENKVIKLRNLCDEFGADVKSFVADSTKIFDSKYGNKIEEGPPFHKELFDRILLDAPCSALGKRPQFFNTTTEKVLKSYVPLQRMLFDNAIELLKLSGTLVYSTCTITVAENEGIVAWALRKHKNLCLVKPDLYFASPGLIGAGLTDEQRLAVQRFGPQIDVDSVGFFIACFIKK